MKSIILFVLATLAHAAPFSVAWDDHPDKSVTEFRVYRIAGTVRTLLATSATSPARIEAATGDTIAVTAFNGMESPLSAFVLIASPPAAPTGLRVVEIQTSANLKDWETIAYVPVAEPKGFVRARTLTLPKP